MANKKLIHTTRASAQNADKKRKSDRERAVARQGKGKVKKNRVHENYWILIQPKIAATK